MTWTDLHGMLLGRAFAAVLGAPAAGAIAFARCLTPDVVEGLAEDDSFAPDAWRVLRVAAADGVAARTISADQAVELREGKGDALLLLVDTELAGAGMDGIYSAAREVDEASLFREARRLASREITGRRSTAMRRYAVASLKEAARGHRGGVAVSPWTEFDFLCRVAAGERSPGAYLHLLGLWPIRDDEKSDHADAMSAARRFTERLLGPAAASLPPSARIEALRLDDESRRLQARLERFLHAVDAKPVRSALQELAQHEDLWVGALRIEPAPRSLERIELTSWRNRNGTMSSWSGLKEADGADEPPALILNTDADRPGATLEVRWKADPANLLRNAADYRVVVQSGTLDEELAARDVPHSARKGGEKCRFSGDDFATLDDDSVLSAKVVVSVLGDDTIERQESEEFVIRFGNPPDRETGGVGVKVRALSEGLVELSGRESVSELASELPLSPAAPNPSGWLTLRTPVVKGRRKSFRVFRPSLIAEVEWDWIERHGRIGRWVVSVRGSGERAGSAKFVPLEGSGAEWDRAAVAGRRLAERFAATGGGVAQVHDEQAKPFALVREFLRAWAALLESDDPALALVNTVEVQSLSGGAIGLIVLPAHPLRVAWHAAYDNLVLHAAFEQDAKPHDIRRELAGLDGAMFPAFLPNPVGGAFVFADTLGFHAVGMVPDVDREPKAAVTMLARALGDTDAADAAPTVGGQSAAVLGGEIRKYLDCHDTARLLLMHALRAGDGMTVARALGAVHQHYRADDVYDEEDADQEHADAPVFSLELYPSVAQRGVTGRFIADARERRRSGAGVLAAEDRWMLESLSLPGGVNLPRLRWARREPQDPKTAAHLAVAFDTFESRVDADPAYAARTPRPYHAFGLLSFYERQYAGRPEPRWISTAAPAEKGEKHPSSRALTETLARLQTALQAAVVRHLDAAGLPALTTEVSADKADSLQELHRLCDWVITLDRNAGVEYFDSPLDNRAIYDAYVIDCVPEREDLGCLQLITSTANLEEVRGLLDGALDRMGLSRSRRNAEFLLERLKALSGRLAIRLTGHRPATSELIALAVAQANCQLAARTDDCWVSLADGFIVPVDDVRDLLPPLSTEGKGDDATGSRPDLIHVTAVARKGLAFRFIEVKHRRHLRAARAPDMLETIRRQTRELRERWLKWYADDDVCSAFRAVRRAKLARVLRFYADKAHRHGLPTQRHVALIAEIDRMVERGGEYAFASGAADDRGWVFCPEFAGDRPLPISPDDWDTRIFLFGPGRLPDSDFRTAPAPLAAAEREPDEPTPPGGQDAAPSDASEAKPSDPPSPAPEAPTAAATERAVTAMLLGADARSNADVRWPLTVQGNPHLLIAGLPGMGKTTCLLHLCRQMAAAQVRPIVFSYHQDIDEKLAQAVDGVRFVDCDAGLGFHPLQVIDRSARRAYLDVAAEMRDIFTAIYPELGDVQGERVRTAVKESFVEAGWGADGAPVGAAEPPFIRFVELLRADPKPDRGLRTLLARLNELDDYGFFDLGESHRSLWEHEQPTVIRVHTTQNENLQRAFAALVFYGLYKDMFRRGLRDRITHAVIFDEAHRAARLKLIPTMAKECRKYGISLVLASQEARDFDSSVFSAIANYLVLRLTEADARFLVRNVATSQQERALIDRIKQMERFKGLFFAEGKSRPHTLNLAFETPQDERRNDERRHVVTDPEVLSGTPCIAGTRVPAHDIADMIANGDTVAAIIDAYPSLTEDQIRAACAYAEAHPRRVMPSHEPPWRKTQPHTSSEMPFDELTQES